MSVIDKEPFINKVLNKQTSGQIIKLHGLMNGEGPGPVFRSLVPGSSALLSVSEAANAPFEVKLELSGVTSQKIYLGYLLFYEEDSQSKCALISYSGKTNQQLTIIEMEMVDDVWQYQILNGNVSISDLRTAVDVLSDSEQVEVVEAVKEALNDGSIKIVAENVSSGAQTAGKALLSDGEGGAAWEEISTTTYKPFPSGWVVDGTTKQFCDSVNNDTTAVDGMGYVGELMCSDLPSGLVNVDTKVEIIAGSGTSNKVIHLVATSGNVEPYHWEYTYWNSGANTSGWIEIGGNSDSDVEVEISTDGGSTYASAITLKEWIDNCELGTVYTTAGTIARISHLISGKTFRVVLIGTNHEVLASDGTTTVKTTWQFLDMPQNQVGLGLPFNVLDWSNGSGRDAAMDYLLGINSSTKSEYPSNMGGLIDAKGLLKVCDTIFESLPQTLKRAIKTVRRTFIKKRDYMSVGANGGAETNYNSTCYLACNLFHLTGTEVGWGSTVGTEGSAYSYLATPANCVRYLNGSASDWWLASPRGSASYFWGIVGAGGGTGYSYTNSFIGVAPAFCI